MSIITNKAAEYRKRAGEAQVRAELATDDYTRKTLLQMAHKWKRMARYEEQTNPQVPPWKSEQPDE